MSVGDKQYECFAVSISEGIARVEMKRPEALNSMIPSFWRELPEIVAQISDDASARAIVLSSTGKHFTPTASSTGRTALPIWICQGLNSPHWPRMVTSIRQGAR